jgi:hypothetical protein
MQKYLPLLLLNFLLASCGSIKHYTTIESKNMAKNEQSIFVEESDTLRIEYRFSQYDGRIVIKIQNKTTSPMYINWQKSAVIANGQSINYYDAKSKVEGVIEGSSLKLSRDYSVQGASFSGVIQNNPLRDFIAPKAFINYLQLPVSSLPAYHMSNKLEVKHQSITYNNSKYNIKVAEFTPETSPLNFSSYLSFEISDSTTKTFAKQHDFYISSYATTKLDTYMLYNDKPMPNNIYMVSTPTNSNSFLTAIAATVIGVTAVALDNYNQNESK